MAHNHGSSGMADMPGMEGSATSMNHGGLEMKMFFHGTVGGDVLWFRSWQPTSSGAYVGACIGLFLLALLDRYLHALWRACASAWARGRVGFAAPVGGGGESYIAVREDDKEDLRALALTAVGVSSALAAKDEEKSCCERKTDTTSKEELARTRSDDSFAPAPCQCGCGGECGASSAPVYRELATPPAEEKPAAKPAATAQKAAGVAVPTQPAYLPAAARRRLDPQRAGRWSRPMRLSADVPRGLLWGVMTMIHYLLMLVVMTFNIWFILAVVVGQGVGEALFGRLGAR